MRFLLGMAEAGFFPGMILYLSYWFPARERARAVGFFMSAIAISYAIGAPISGGDHVDLRRRRRPRRTGSGCSCSRRCRRSLAGVLRAGASSTTGRRTRAGWRRREGAGWPSASRARSRVRLERERHWLGEVLQATAVSWSFGAPVLHPMVVNVYGLSFWVGEVVDQIKGVSDVGKGFVTAIPYAFAIFGIVADPALLRPLGATASCRVGIRLVIAAGGLRGLARVGPAGRGHRGARRPWPVLPARRHRRVLDDARRAAQRHGGGRRHRPDQLDREPRRLRRAVPGRADQGRDWARPTGASSRSRSSSRSAASSPCAWRTSGRSSACGGRSDPLLAQPSVAAPSACGPGHVAG